MNRAAREQAERDAIRREFWARVQVRNGCVPPQAIHVDDDDHRGPPVWLGVLIPLVAVVLVGGFIVACIAVARHFGWVGAVVALVAGAFAPWGSR